MEKRARILVADDEPNLREHLAYALEAEGYEAEAAPDGEAAWEASARAVAPSRAWTS